MYNSLVSVYSYGELYRVPTMDGINSNAYLIVLDYDNKYVKNDFIEEFERTFIFDIKPKDISDMGVALILKAAYEAIENEKMLMIISSDKSVLLDLQTLIIQIFALKQQPPISTTSVDITLNNLFYTVAVDIDFWNKLTYGR